MSTKRSVKLIKNGERKNPKLQAEIESAAGPNRWSSAVRGWVGEFQQQQQRREVLPAFDSLFKEEES